MKRIPFSLRHNVPRAQVEEDESFVMTQDIGRRESPGVRKKLRMIRNGEAYGYIDPDELSSLGEPPPQIQAALEDVLGDWAKDDNGAERIKVRVHPHFHRWCLYEREYRPELGGQELWRCFYIFMGDPVKGKLPSDMDGDLYKYHFTGRIGEYVEPDRSHFEMIERFNRHKYGVDAVNEHAGALQDKELAEAEREETERTEAFLDDNWFLVADEANQKAGSGQYMRDSHCRNYGYKSNVERWRRVQKEGYVVIEKKSKEEYDKEVREDLRTFAQKWAEARGFRRNWRPSKEELRKLLLDGNFIDESVTADEVSSLVEKTFERDLSDHIENNASSDAEIAEYRQALARIRQSAIISK